MVHICTDREGFVCWNDKWLQSQEVNLHLQAAAQSVGTVDKRIWRTGGGEALWRETLRPLCLCKRVPGRRVKSSKVTASLAHLSPVPRSLPSLRFEAAQLSFMFVWIASPRIPNKVFTKLQSGPDEKVLIAIFGSEQTKHRLMTFLSLCLQAKEKLNWGGNSQTRCGVFRSSVMSTAQSRCGVGGCSTYCFAKTPLVLQDGADQNWFHSQRHRFEKITLHLDMWQAVMGSWVQHVLQQPSTD